MAELQAHVGQALADTRMHENSLRRSMVIARLLLVAAKLIENAELAARLDLIEQRLNVLDQHEAA